MLTYLPVVLSSVVVFAQPAGATARTGAVGVLHYQYHIDQQPHQRGQHHDPAGVGAELAPEHSAEANVGHFVGASAEARLLKRPSVSRSSAHGVIHLRPNINAPSDSVAVSSPRPQMQWIRQRFFPTNKNYNFPND